MNSPIEVVRSDNNPDTLAVQLGRVVAGAAIDDHFLDVVLPTVAQAISRQRDKILAETDKVIQKKLGAISEKLDVDLSQVVGPSLKRIVAEAITKQGGTVPGMQLTIFDPANERLTIMSRQHYMFPALLRLFCTKDRNDQSLNIAVVGPAGNGKTAMALGCANALGLEAILQPFNPQTTKSDLLGYMAADGKYVPSPFYDAFSQGKLYIADEFDAANPSVAVTLNAAVANRTLTFPNLETVRAHPNFRAVFIMNTGGTGADHQYTGRMRQDAATLDRMVYLAVPIDKGLEAAIAGLEEASPKMDIAEGGRFKNNKEILATVRAVRKAIEDLQMKYIVSPRATLHATAMHGAEFGKKMILEACLWKGMPETDRELILNKVKESRAA